MSAMAASRCPTPFAFPFTPLGLSLFDIDPSRILSLLHHQTWLAEEALRTRGLLSAPKDFSHRFTTLSDLLTKDYQPDGAAGVTGYGTAKQSLSQSQPQQSITNRSSDAQYKAQQQQQQQPLQQQQETTQQQQQPQLPHAAFNLRYTTPTSFFPQAKSSKSAGAPSPLQIATSSTISSELQLESQAEVKRNANDNDDVTIVELPNERNVVTPNSGALLYKESLEQLLAQQRRRVTSNSTPGTSVGGGTTGAGVGASVGGGIIVDASGLRQYTQLLLSGAATPVSCTDTSSSCKEKSSSSSTSSTPPPSGTLLAQHQQLSQMLKSPSDTCSSIFSETIEEETRCIVCNAHFPNVWLLEQHAALQHPHIGPGEEKPFICEQCGQSYRYRSAYAKHKEQNHRARLPADKLFTCDVCGMQFRYLKSFKKHRLNHALERLHGKKSIGVGVGVGIGASSMRLVSGSSSSATAAQLEQDVVTSSQEPMLADEGEDLRINVKRESDVSTGQQDAGSEEHEQDNTIDSAGITMLYNDNNSSASASTSATEPNISSSDGIHSTNKRSRLLNSAHHLETDPSYHHHQHQHQHQQHQHHHHQQQQQQQQQSQSQQQAQQQQLPPHLAHVTLPMTSAAAGSSSAVAVAAAAAAGCNSSGSSGNASTANSSVGSGGGISSLSSLTSLINAERIPNEQFLGLNPQEASILNFLRVDAAERQRDKRPATSRFACPFCGKCVRSKENLKLHVRKHTGERPFVCLFCGRAFGGKSDLTRHLRIHTGERPYHCESCGKCFARADYLSKHLTTHIHNAPR